MRKILISLVVVLFATVAYADNTKTCKVLETDGSVEVSVMVTDASLGRCIVSFSNDTDRNVNVRYTVKDVASQKELFGSKLVYANSEATKEVVFGCKVNPNNVKVSSLTGERCQ